MDCFCLFYQFICFSVFTMFTNSSIFCSSWCLLLLHVTDVFKTRLFSVFTLELCRDPVQGKSVSVAVANPDDMLWPTTVVRSQRTKSGQQRQSIQSELTTITFSWANCRVQELSSLMLWNSVRKTSVEKKRIRRNIRTSHMCELLPVSVCVCVCVCALTNGTLCGNPSVHNTRCGECLHCGENIVSPHE